MAEIFDFYVADNRTIKFNPIEPILQEDNGVAVWRFRIPKMLNNIDMSGFAWWFVYINAAKQKYSEPLTLTADADDPDNYCIADYTIDYGISLTPGSFTFALEAINANGSGEIIEEWHTKTYSHSVIGTLQGNQAEYSETESDIISALMVQIQQKYNSLVGGATPIPVASVSQMTDTSKIYLLTTDNNWYYYNGTAWVSGGQYASGIVIDPTLTQSGQAADAKVVGDEIEKKVSKPTSSPNGTAGQLLRTNGDGTTQWVDQGLPTDEQTAEAIDEWLTNHPEATTTVQDGSLTASKFNTSFRTSLYTAYKTLSEMIADTALINGALIYIADTAEIFEITSTIPADNSYETLANGLYAHRIVITTTPNAEKYVQNNDYAVSIMGDTAMSYIKYSNIDNDTSTRFFYDTSGLYSNWGTLPTETRDGKHGITCSPFVMDMLYGVRYENSAYIDGVNKLNPSMLRDTPLISYFYPPQIGSKYLATYAIQNGFAFFPEADLSNLRAGDVIFTSLEGSEDNIYGVGHCEVIGYWINNNKFLVWHAGSVPRTNVRTVSSFADQVVLCARFPFKNSHLELTNIVKYGEADVPHTVNNTWVVADYHLSESLDANKYYTAIFKMTSANDISDQYPAIRLTDGTVLSATYSGATKKPINDVYCIPFKAETSANTIRLGMTRANDTVSYDTVTVDWMVVVKGIITSPIDYISPPFELLTNNASELVPNEKIVTFTPTSGSAYESFGNCFYYKIGTRVHIHVGISGLIAGTATTIYQMPAGYKPYAHVATAGQGDSITNKAVMEVGISGSIRIASESTYALVDIEYDAFQ